MGKVKGGIGLLNAKFHPVSGSGYTTAVELGSTVKAYLSLETEETKVYGDDVEELVFDIFKNGLLEVETLMDDLEVETKIFGGTYSSTNSDATDNISDIAPDGAVSYIRKLLKKNETTGAKEIVYRAVVLPLCTAKKSSQKEEADTKGESLEFKNSGITFNFRGNSSGDWRKRKDCTTLSDAQTYISTNTAAASASD